MSDVRIGHDLECQRAEWLIVARPAQHRLGAAEIHAFHRLHIHRRRQEINHRVEQRLNPLVLKRRPRHHRHQFQRQRRTPQRLAQFRRLELVLLEIFRQHGIVMLGDVLHNFLAMLFVKFRAERRSLDRRSHFRPLLLKRRIPQLIERNRLVFGAERLVLPDNRPLFDEINHADEGIFFSDGILQRNGVGRKPLAHRANRMVEIRADAVHLINERNPWHAILVRLPPHRFRLRLHARHRVKHRHRAVQHAQRALHFHGEIHVPRRINNIDAIILAQALP